MVAASGYEEVTKFRRKEKREHDIERKRSNQEINGIEKHKYAMRIEMVLEKQKYRRIFSQVSDKVLNMNYEQTIIWTKMYTAWKAAYPLMQ